MLFFIISNRETLATIIIRSAPGYFKLSSAGNAAKHNAVTHCCNTTKLMMSFPVRNLKAQQGSRTNTKQNKPSREKILSFAISLPQILPVRMHNANNNNHRNRKSAPKSIDIHPYAYAQAEQHTTHTNEKSSSKKILSSPKTQHHTTIQFFFLGERVVLFFAYFFFLSFQIHKSHMHIHHIWGAPQLQNIERTNTEASNDQRDTPTITKQGNAWGASLYFILYTFVSHYSEAAETQRASILL